ncbi:MAG: DUF177 domain-containing protein [Prevotella sp.]|jgi:uncharacterized metal-binding protein YceD (DUF177 family)|nr:DUF177 domain-containing protein [Prevotella sp.]MCI1282344.1 DUF177 domain-containing protein [Prevotella sp.]
MSRLEPFKIDLKGLKEGINVLEYDLDDEFFESVEAPEIRKGKLHTTLSIQRIDDFFELCFHTSGSVIIACDLCLEDMEQPIETTNSLMVKFGEEYSEEDDLVIVEKDDGVLDISWFIYEFIDLNIPIKHVHAPGKCNPAMMKVLEEHSASRRGNENEEKPIDPRWATLSKIKNKE